MPRGVATGFTPVVVRWNARALAAAEGGAGRSRAATGVGRGDSKPVENDPQAFILVALIAASG